jgi:hypothetical protein
MLCFTLTYSCLLDYIPQQGEVHEEIARGKEKVTVHISLKQRKGRFIMD